MEKVELKARAKINLSLNVTGRRENGYHDVRMIMQTIDLYDEIEICRIDTEDEGRIVIVSGSEDLPDDKDNLMYKAARLIMDECRIEGSVKISCRKNIPIAAGMAGGSTDAAAVFKGMNRLYELKLSDEKLCEMGVRIGADVPYCIIGGTALSEGIGEILTPLPPMPDCFILIAKPGISVSTAYVYTAFDDLEEKTHPDVDSMVTAIEEGDIGKMADLLGNSLEGVTQEEYPIIKEIKEMMLGNKAIGALMSGSGPTVFGIYKNMKEAEEASHKLREAALAKDIFVTAPYNVR